MKIDRKKIVNRCGYDQNECMLLAKRLAECPDDNLIQELKKISVWNFGKCELGLWADLLDRLDIILERAVTKVGRWRIQLDLPENSSMVDDVVTILKFTGHLIEHSIYRYIYGSWAHILALFGSENMDILLAVLGLSYNFSKRSNYFMRLDAHNKRMILDRLVSIAETWGGVENGFGLAACCDPTHFPKTAGDVYFEYCSDKTENQDDFDSNDDRSDPTQVWHRITLHKLHSRDQSPSEIMEDLLARNNISPSKQMALFARVRLATYFANPEQRHKCICARLQSLSILSYTFEMDERHLYTGLLDELVDVLRLPDGQYTGIKACTLRTMTATVNSHRLPRSLWMSSTGLSTYHGILPNLTRQWVRGLVNETIDAPVGSTNQQFTTALLSFLYHLACYEEHIGPTNAQNEILSSSGILDTMLQLISWHTSRSDCLSYVTRAVRVTDQILISISSARPQVVNILVERLKYEVNFVLNGHAENQEIGDSGPALNTQRSGLMKSILNLLKRLCLAAEWDEVLQAVMDGELPVILRQIFLNGSTHFTPQLALCAMETITNYLYTYPSRISSMQDKNITSDILKSLTDQPLPHNRDFLVQLPSLLNTLALNSRGIESIISSGILTRYLNTLVSPEYLPTMKTRRVRDFLSQMSHTVASTTGPGLSNNLTAGQMSNAVQELLRSHSELKPIVFKGLVARLRQVVEIGNMQSAPLIPEPQCINGLVDPSNSSIAAFSGSLPDVTQQSSTAPVSSTRDEVSQPSSMLEDDVVMLSGGEDEEDDDNDLDDVNRASQGVSATSVVAAEPQLSTVSRPSDSRSDSLDNATLTRDKPEGAGDPSLQHKFLTDYMLNTCKFLEKLLPSVSHVTEAMCHHFMSQQGIEVLLNMLQMSGLPFDFPVSASCASLCKIFEDLSNSAHMSEVVKPLYKLLGTSLTKLAPLRSPKFTMTSELLKRYHLKGDLTLLHEIVVTATIICILVQIIDHVKPEARSDLFDSIAEHHLLYRLGPLYLGISWEAGILLKLLSREATLTASDIFCDSESTVETNWSSSSSLVETVRHPSVDVGFVAPPFVEAMSIYTLLKPSLSTASRSHPEALLNRYPHLTKTTERILHITSYLINSITELCTAMGRILCSRSQVNRRRRRLTSSQLSDQISVQTKNYCLAQIASFLCESLSWEPSPSTATLKHPSAMNLICAMRYASVRLSNTLFPDSAVKESQSTMLKHFVDSGGMHRLASFFMKLIEFDAFDSMVMGNISTPLAELIEVWIACVDRICNSGVYAPSLSVYDSLLLPLKHLCTRPELQSLFTRRAVEHLLSMLVPIVPYLFDQPKKMVASDAALSASAPEPKLSEPMDTVGLSIGRLSPISITPRTVGPPTEAGDVDSNQTPAVNLAATDLIDSTSVSSERPDVDSNARNSQEAIAFPSPSISLPPPFERVGDSFNPQQLFYVDTNTISTRVGGDAPRNISPVPENRDSVVSCLCCRFPDVAVTKSTWSLSMPKPDGGGSQSLTALSYAGQFLLPSIPHDSVVALKCSVKENLFKTCYAIATRHRSDQILHRITELLLSSGNEECYIDKLFTVVSTNLSALLGVQSTTTVLTNRNSHLSSVNEFTALATAVDTAFQSTEPLSDQLTVGLHLATLLFSRCQSMCTHLAHTHNLPALLIDFIDTTHLTSLDSSIHCTASVETSLPLHHEHMDVDQEPLIGTGGLGSTNHYSIILLACLLLDQYQRSIQAINLRKKSIKLYAKAHDWYSFDKRAGSWQQYSSENSRIVDTSFHLGNLGAQCQINRRVYTIEFPTMSQVDSDNMHRRPVLLFPVVDDESASEITNTDYTAGVSDYERLVLDTNTPPELDPEQRTTLINGLLKQFKHSNQSDPPVSSAIPSDCLNAILRLLIRLASSSYEDAQKVGDLNFLSILFNYPHSRSFTSEYSAFVGMLLNQVFDDAPTVLVMMQRIMNKICRSKQAITNDNGTDVNMNGCRDLFYLLNLCVPLFTKDFNAARSVSREVFSLLLTDADVEARTIPKHYTISPPSASPDDSKTLFSLSVSQKSIVSYLIELILRPSKANEVGPQPLRQQKQSSTSGSNSDNADPSPSCPWAEPQVGQPGRSHTLGITDRFGHVTNDKASASSSPDHLNKSEEQVLLGKADALQYLVDLIASHRAVTEFVSSFKCGRQTHGKDFLTPSSSFVAHLFTYQLSGPDTTELTISLLENLVLLGSDNARTAIVNEFKLSLNRIASMVNRDKTAEQMKPVQMTRNERISSHMLFFDRLLNLQHPQINRLVRLIYKYRLPTDIAKLIALVDYNTSSTQSTITLILQTLESLTAADRQMSRWLPAAFDRITNRPDTSVATTTNVPTNTSVTQVASSVASTTQAQSSTTNIGQDRSSRGIRCGTHGGNYLSESDNDNDDDDDMGGIVDQQTNSGPTDREGPLVLDRQTSDALDLVLDDVLVTRARIVMGDPDDDDDDDDVDEQHHWNTVSVPGDPEDSVIFVHNDEDEGSAGQGEGDNSQEDEDEDEDDGGMVRDADDDDEDEDDDDEDDNDDDEDMEDGDDNENEDDEVAFVLQSRARDRPLARNTRRHVVGLSSVSTAAENPVRGDDSIMIHDVHDEDDGSFDEDGLDASDHDIDDEPDDLDYFSDPMDILFGVDGRNLPDSHSVVAMFYELLNFTDTPHRSTLGSTSRLSNRGRDRLGANAWFRGSAATFPDDFTQSSDSPGNLSVLLPRSWNSSDAPSREHGGTALLRFGNGSSMLYPGSGVSSRTSFPSGVNFVTTVNGRVPTQSISQNQPSTAQQPLILPSQHPLLQAPSVSPSQSDRNNNTTTGLGYSGSNPRLNRMVIANTFNTPLANPVISIRPSMPAHHLSNIGGHHHRSRNIGISSNMTTIGPVVTGSSGLRQRGPPTRIYASLGMDHNPFRSHSPGDDSNSSVPSSSLNVPFAARVVGFSANGNPVRDYRSGPEADSLIWGMLTNLTNLTEGQRSALNSTSAPAILHPSYHRFFSNSNRAYTSDIGTRSNAFSRSRLHPTTRVLPPAYRHWLILSRLLFGYEIMDLLLIIRHHVFDEAARRRRDYFDRRVQELERLTTAVKSPAISSVDATEPNLLVTVAREEHPESDVASSPVSNRTIEIDSSEVVGTQDVEIDQCSTVADPDASHPETETIMTPDESNATPVPSDVTVTEVPQSAPTDPPTSSTAVAPRPVPETDEEVIQSLIETGMDPSFLDALPEDMRQEVIADHVRARQLQHQISSMNLPQHVNSEWLNELPPHIQEEVLAQIRSEQQQTQEQQQPTSQDNGTSTVSTTASSVTNPPAPATESNTAFLQSLSSSLRREVLADMDESQLEMLPSDLAAEARQLRRESEERYAMAVQSGILGNIFQSRPAGEYSRRNNTTSNALGSQGRWDVRFDSINQFLRQLHSSLHVPSGTRSSTTQAAETSSVSTVRGRELIDSEGLTCVIALLMVNGAFPQQRRNAPNYCLPLLASVIRNLACHFGTRVWIVNTLFSLFESLNTKPISDGSDSSDSQSTSSKSTRKDVECKNTIFYAGFESALGCWIRIFYPISSSSDDGSDLTQKSKKSARRDHSCSDQGSELPIPGSSTSGHRYTIHPQATPAAVVAFLEALNELAQAFPSHFYPRLPLSGGNSKSGQSSNDAAAAVDLPGYRTAFWDTFNRISEMAPSIGQSSTSHLRTGRAHGIGRKRQTSHSTKQAVESTHPIASPSLPMDTHSSFEVNQEVNQPSTSSKRSGQISPHSSDCFTQLAGLICHPLIQPDVVQMRLLSILSNVVQDYILARNSSAGDAARPAAEGRSEESLTLPQPSDATSSLQQQSQQVSGATEQQDDACLLSLEAMQALCSLVIAPKTNCRDLACQLITDLSRIGRSNRETLLQLFSASIGTLVESVSSQLKLLIKEIQSADTDASLNQPAVSDIESSSKMGMSSSSGRISTDSATRQFDSLPDRFSGSGEMVVISSNNRSQSLPAHNVAPQDLAFSSMQIFSGPNSDQSRLRSALGYMLRLAMSSNSTSEPVALESKDIFHCVPGLSEFWPLFSAAFELVLRRATDQGTVLLLQPLLEAFCMCHVHLVKDYIMIRRRISSTIPGFRTNTSTHLDLLDMVPMFQLRVDEPPTGGRSRELTTTESTSGSNLTSHLNLDIFGPISPPCVGTDEEHSTGGVQIPSPLLGSVPNNIVRFAERHRDGLNRVLRQSSDPLGESPFAVFLPYPRVLDFDIKRRIFRQQLQSISLRSLSSRYDEEPVVISRDRIFEDSYARLHRKTPSEWKHKFVIRFQNEEGQDAGGPLREWYILMSREIFNPNYCLFRTSPADRVTYTINPSSYVNSNHLSYFEFVGRFIAKAIYDNKLLECYFSRSFYKHILGVPVKCSDLESDDYEFYKGLEFLLKHHISDLGYDLSFSTEISEFGKTETRDLIENGRNVLVTEESKREYVRLVCQERMTGAIRQQLDAFLAGFYSIIPKQLISVFNEQEIELLISGLPNIDISDLKANTQYSKYQSSSPQIEWFWRSLDSFDQEDRARFLQFVTGTSRVPLGGFANLEGMHGPTKFQITRATVSSTNHLPCAHTCFNTLVLPAYDSYEQLRSRLLTAIRECSEGYGMA